MYHSTSGKCGFDYYHYEGCPLNADGSYRLHIPREQLINILKLEEQYRFSEEYQQMYTEAGDSLDRLEEITEELQRRALQENGIAIEDHEAGKNGQIPNALKAYRSIRGRLRHDEEISQLVVYMREDRSKRGTLAKGDIAPDAELLTLDGEETTLYSIMEQRVDNTRPLVILAGSVS
ncbi:hypothetical protein QOT17_004319 [Balamuthia mandrillaris]